MVASSAGFQDQRLRILRMVEEGKISASEGVALLSALSSEHKIVEPQPVEESGEQPMREPKPVAVNAPRPLNGGPRWFKVRITDINTGKSKTSVTIPLGLVDWGLRIGAHYAPDAEIDMGQISEMLRMGVEGKLIDVIDEEDGEHVEIFVE